MKGKLDIRVHNNAHSTQNLFQIDPIAQCKTQPLETSRRKVVLFFQNIGVLRVFIGTPVVQIKPTINKQDHNEIKRVL